jgi:multimeric flavodoxin WrbA
MCRFIKHLVTHKREKQQLFSMNIIPKIAPQIKTVNLWMAMIVLIRHYERSCCLMKIVAVNGSHKGKAGNTDIMVTVFLQGAEDAGAETVNILLAEKDIKFCQACKACWFSSPGKCVLDDDMNELVSLLRAADVWLWATPLYFDNISGMLKTFIDRLMVLGSPRWTKDAAGECRHLTATPIPKLMMLANCGYPERSQFQAISHWFNRHARNLGTQIIGEIYCSEGALLSAQDKQIRPIADRYLQVLQTAGREIATGLALSPNTEKLLEQPLIPADLYIQGVQQYVESML